MENKKLVIFDFDGVLVNTIEFWFKIHKGANGDLTWERFQEISHGDYREVMRVWIEKEGYVRPPNADNAYHAELGLHSTEELIRSAVIDLSQRYIITIISSSSDGPINDFIKKEHLENYFSDILGSESHTSKRFKINLLLEKYKLESKKAVIITDTLGDIREANECNIFSIGVTWGQHDKETLLKGNPTAIIEDPSHLQETIEKVLK